MINLSNFIKNRRVIIILIFSIFCIIFIIIKISNNEPKTPTPISNVDDQVASYKGIMTGEPFNEDKVNELLGFPVSSTASGEVKTNTYRSSSQYRNNEVRIQNGEVDFIREVINSNSEMNANEFRKIYGIADAVLYNKISDDYFDLYVYFKKGIAYLGHQDGTIIEIWYFKPTDLENFINNWAPNYQDIPFEGQTSH